MSDINAYLTRIANQFQGTAEEATVSNLLLDETINLQLGDARLNGIAALTYNGDQCDRIFGLITRTCNPQEYPWKVLQKTLLLTKTIVLYGSERAIDSVITMNGRGVFQYLQDYNSVTTPTINQMLFYTAGTDYGAPVRELAKELKFILDDDNEIRKARSTARGEDSLLIPMGSIPEMKPSTTSTPQISYGQGVTKSIGASHGLEAIPGMYDGRPERYFDRDGDERRTKPTGDRQFTREAFAAPLIDFLDSNHEEGSDSASMLPEAQYLPALEKQKQLEKQLAEQQAQLQMLMQMAAANATSSSQQQQQHLSPQQQQQSYSSYPNVNSNNNPMSTNPMSNMLSSYNTQTPSHSFGPPPVPSLLSQQTHSGMGQPGMGMPQGMGQPGMGQPGMGQPGMGMPQGMGQPGMGMPQGMGQPGIGMPQGMGQPGMGMPQGMGQPGMGMPQGMGQPGMGMPQGMGQSGMGIPQGMGQSGMGQSGMGMPQGMGQPGIGMPQRMGQPGMGMPEVMGQSGMGIPQGMGGGYNPPGGYQGVPIFQGQSGPQMGLYTQNNGHQQQGSGMQFYPPPR
eukprot:gene1784-3463_t